MAITKGFDSTDEIFKTSQDDKEFLGTLSKWHDGAKKNRQRFDWDWYINQNFYKGNHYIQFNKRTFQLVTPPKPAGQVRLVVNKIYPILRAIRNFATSYRPRWFVTADTTAQSGIDDGDKAQDTLDYYYDHLDMFVQVNAITNLASKFGIGYWQYWWDEEAEGPDNQTGDVVVMTRDPFDVYLDPSGIETGDIQNCRFIDIVVSRPVQDIINNPEYDLATKLEEDDITADSKRAASDFKDLLIKHDYLESFDEAGNLKTKLVHETLYKKRVKQDDGTFETEVWVATWIDSHLLRKKQTEFTKYNLIAVPSDNNPIEIYGEGYVKNLIPPQRILNRLESQVVEYNNLVNRGRILADKDAGINKVTNTTGEVIEHNAGASIQFWNPTGLAPDIHQQISRVSTYMEEISGVRQTFLGGNAIGLRSGVALEAMKAQTANNLQDLKDNIEFGLGELGEAILELLANKVIVARTLQKRDRVGKRVNFKIKGSAGVKKGAKTVQDVGIIGNKNEVKVTIGSGLAYTKEGLSDRLDKLLEMKAIAPATYLRALEFGDIDGAIQESTQSQFNDAMMQHVASNGVPGVPPGMPGAPVPPAGGMPMGAPAGSPPPAMAPQGPPPGAAPAGSPQPGQQPQDNWTKLAMDEDHAMLLGKVVAPTEGAPREHTAIHIAWSQSPEVQDNDHLMKALFEHIKGEEAMQGAPHANMPGQAPAPATGPTPAIPLAPIKVKKKGK